MLSDKWVSIDTIIERVGRSFPDMAVDRNHAAEWCFDVVKDVGAWPGFKEERGLVLDVENSRVELPCNTYRLLSLLPNRGNLSSRDRELFRYQNMGSHVLLSNDNNTPVTQVVVDVLLFHVDENGLPMIYERSQEACFYYILKRMKEGDFINGKLPPDRWQWITSQYDLNIKVAKASMRFMSREDFDAIVRVARSMIRPTHYAAN